MDSVRTWIEIDSKALRHNTEQFLRLIHKYTRLMAVVKSNAYGHGLVQVAAQLANFQFPRFASARTKRAISNFQKIWFGVDSVVEALRLRKEVIRNPILVLGYTLPSRV